MLHTIPERELRIGDRDLYTLRKGRSWTPFVSLLYFVFIYQVQYYSDHHNHVSYEYVWVVLLLDLGFS